MTGTFLHSLMTVPVSALPTGRWPLTTLERLCSKSGTRKCTELVLKFISKLKIESQILGISKCLLLFSKCVHAGPLPAFMWPVYKRCPTWVDEFEKKSPLGTCCFVDIWLISRLYFAHRKRQPYSQMGTALC